jgi:hypothetical protein
MTIEHMDSFGINSTKSCDVYLVIQMILNQNILSYKVVDHVKYYNFDIKFVFIGHHMRKVWKFSCTLSQSVYKTDSNDPILVLVLG